MLLLQLPALETQTSHALSLWIGNTWTASLCWPSGPAGVALEGCLACFVRRARGRSRCHADRLPALLLSAGLMALQTPQPGLFCSAATLAQSSANHTQSPTLSFTYWPLDVRPSYALSLVPTPSKTVDQSLPSDGTRMGKACACLVAPVGLAG